MTCPDTIEGQVVAARLAIRKQDVPPMVTCIWDADHNGSHGATVAGYRIWWWIWGNGRTQLRGIKI